MSPPDFLFHYTVGPKLALIHKTGSLIPTGFGLALSKREKPVLWWSANPVWEPTATKILSLDGGRTFRRPSFDKMEQVTGAYRFQLEAKKSPVKLIGWQAVCRAALIHPKEVALMLQSGLELGARPADWWGTLHPVPTTSLRLERWAEGRWVPLEGGLEEAARQWAAEGSRFVHTSATQEPKARGL